MSAHLEPTPRKSRFQPEPLPDGPFDLKADEHRRLVREFDGRVGAGMLGRVEAFVLRFCAFPSEHYGVAIALWVAHTHCIDAFEVTPRLALVSETKQSGKSRTLEVVDLLAARSRYVGSMSAAYMFRLVDAEKPTLLLDEVDAVFGPKARDNEDLRALMNVGFKRSATVGRCVGDGSKQTAKEFAAFCPVALAGIGDCLPDTILDRSIVLRMRRRAPDEHIEPLRYRKVRPEAEKLRAELEEWGDEHVDRLSKADPVMPDGIADRPADTWEALLAVADCAGGDWPSRAREACLALNDARAAEDSSASIRLLTEIRDVLGDDDHIFSATLCERLNGLEEAPWAGWNGGKGIQPKDVAKRLKGYGISSRDVRIVDDVRKGYVAAELADTFVRYLPSPRGNSRYKGNAPSRDVALVAPVADTEGEGLRLAEQRATEARARKQAREAAAEASE
jgi:hypothetical protein